MTLFLTCSLEAVSEGCVGCTPVCGSTGSYREAEVGDGFLKVKAFLFHGFLKVKGLWVLGFFLTWHDFKDKKIDSIGHFSLDQ